MSPCVAGDKLLFRFDLYIFIVVRLNNITILREEIPGFWYLIHLFCMLIFF